jgi:hypothetical protein
MSKCQDISRGTWKWLHRENTRPITAAVAPDKSSAALTHGRKPDEGDQTMTVVSKSLRHGGDESVQIAKRWNVHYRASPHWFRYRLRLLLMCELVALTGECLIRTRRIPFSRRSRVSIQLTASQ